MDELSVRISQYLLYLLTKLFLFCFTISMPVKKKVVARKPATKTVKKTAPRSRKRSSRSSEMAFVPFTVHRVILITTCFVLFIFAFILFAKPNVTQSVAGVSIARGLFAQTTVSLPQINGAVSYNIYYKQTTDATYRNAVRKIPASTATYTISYLKKNTSYQYRISAINPAGREFWWSEPQALTNLQAM